LVVFDTVVIGTALLQAAIKLIRQVKDNYYLIGGYMTAKESNCKLAIIELN
jgi:hypothetical protein